MSATYTTIQWNRHKKVYDTVLAGAVALYLATFLVVGKVTHRGDESIGTPVLLIRALGTLAIVLLHIVLCIGPLARLDARFAALLYNRRHLGVTTFLVALSHATLVILYYGGFGVDNPFLALLARNTAFASISGFPFEVLGLFALAVLFVMAATSHDFWLKNLTPRVWKGLHMLVYAAYAAVVMHVALGILQSERNAIYPSLLSLGVATVGTLHIVAGRREVRKDLSGPAVPAGLDWIDVGDVSEIPDSRAKVVCLKGVERIAVFRYDGKVSAVSNACAHQGGPLGEGKIVDGCLTCPWHGYQYLVDKGRSPPPYTETIPTYEVRVEGTRILINPRANPPGTPVEPARITATGGAHA